jgi:UDP-GlcNAc3NAcA epimerase
MKILTIVGARPQFIKAASVSRALKKFGLEEYFVHTGQHFDNNMSQIFFDELGIPAPNQNLEIAESSHARQTGKMMMRLEELMLEEKPNCVLVYGDTNSTIAGALAASKLQIPVAHVEAGLRSFNRAMPEEINRVVTDQLSAVLYSTSPVATSHLRNEGVAAEKILEVGDVMFDGVLHYSGRVDAEGRSPKALAGIDSQYVLSTIHRAESTDDPKRLRSIFNGLILANKTIPVIIPLHPRTRKALQSIDMLAEVESSLKVIAPVGYLDMLSLQKNASLIFTDSGGIQKEAYYLQVPCVTCRSETEWVETVERGSNTLINPDSDPNGIKELIQEKLNEGFVDRGQEPLYGGGHASELIAKNLASFTK